MSQSLQVQFWKVRGRGLFVCMGLLQAKNSELGEVWLVMVQISGAKREKEKLR